MITRVILSLIAVALGWLGLLAVVMVVSDAAPAALVLLPSDSFLSELPQGVAILSRGALSATLTGDMPGLGAVLYRAGAFVVLPAGLMGCAPLTS